MKIKKVIKTNLSYSKLTTLQDCERRFYYQYIAKIEEEPQVINYGDLGSRGHLVLEDFYKYVNIESDDIEKEFNRVLAKLYHRHFKGTNDPKANFATGVHGAIQCPFEALRSDARRVERRIQDNILIIIFQRLPNLENPAFKAGFFCEQLSPKY